MIVMAGRLYGAGNSTSTDNPSPTLVGKEDPVGNGGVFA
jgi:hypothetical protein